MEMMWYPLMKKIEFVTVKDMYARTKENHIKLLSDYSAEFWAEYLENYERYDRIFNRMYMNSYYFIQDSDESVDDGEDEDPDEDIDYDEDDIDEDYDEEALSVDDAAMIWASNGKDEDYTFGYTEEELEEAFNS